MSKGIGQKICLIVKGTISYMYIREKLPFSTAFDNANYMYIINDIVLG